jgi:3D (Asp-Asp-Asp) domain-containing protein
MKNFTLLLFMLAASFFACCSYNAYVLSKASQASSVELSPTPVSGPPTTNNKPPSGPPTPVASSAATPAPSGPSGPNGPIVQNPPSTGQMTTIKATFYTDVGTMADGHPTHVGACASYLPQFPFGTMLKLYHPNDLNQPAYTCTVEDSGTHICQDNIDVWIASVPEALQLGVQDMQAQVVGLDKTIAQDAANNHPASPGCELGKTH